jgi:hypothetical protein
MGQTVNLLLILRRFESCSPHHFLSNKLSQTIVSGSSSVGRASAFQAEGRGFESRLPLIFLEFINAKKFALLTSQCSSGVEHFLGKEEAMGSIPIIGSLFSMITRVIIDT